MEMSLGTCGLFGAILCTVKFGNNSKSFFQGGGQLANPGGRDGPANFLGQITWDVMQLVWDHYRKR